MFFQYIVQFVGSMRVVVLTHNCYEKDKEKTNKKNAKQTIKENKTNSNVHQKLYKRLLLTDKTCK